MTLEYYEKVSISPEDYIRVDANELKEFVKQVFMKYGVPEADAEVTADNLVTADLRGIESHGVQRLKRYIDGIKLGGVKVKPNIKIVKEGASYALIDGGSGLGQVVSWKAVQTVVEKAKKNDVAIVGVYMSQHFGISGYWALKIMEHDLIGISLTNSRPLVAHTGSLVKMIGTNPIAFAAPKKTPPPFVLDMATSIVPSGKLEVYRRKEKPIPEGWGIGSDGEIERNPIKVLKEGALLPLGGLGEILAGHKGYGLSLMVDVLSGILTGAAWSLHIGQTQSKEPANVGHFFMAINIEAFTPLEKFKERMDEMVNTLKSAQKHPDFDRIWIAGEKSYYTTQTRLKIGVPLYKKVYEELKEIGGEVGVEFPKIKKV